MSAIELGRNALLAVTMAQPGALPADLPRPDQGIVENTQIPSHITGDLNVTVFQQEAPASPLPSAEPIPSMQPIDPGCEPVVVAVEDVEASSAPEDIAQTGGDLVTGEGDPEEVAAVIDCKVHTAEEILQTVLFENEEFTPIEFKELKRNAMELWNPDDGKDFEDQMSQMVFPWATEININPKGYSLTLKDVEKGYKDRHVDLDKNPNIRRDNQAQAGANWAYLLGSMIEQAGQAGNFELQTELTQVLDESIDYTSQLMYPDSPEKATGRIAKYLATDIEGFKKPDPQEATTTG